VVDELTVPDGASPSEAGSETEVVEAAEEWYLKNQWFADTEGLDLASVDVAEEDLGSFQLFPLERHPPSGGYHGFNRRDENGEYRSGRSREFEAHLSPHVARLIEEDEARKWGIRYILWAEHS
jgi:hypothetical protein